MSSEPDAQLLAEVGQRIRACRVAAGLNPDQRARLTGFIGPAQSPIETGKRDTRLTTVARSGAALSVPPEALPAEGAFPLSVTMPLRAAPYPFKVMAPSGRRCMKPRITHGPRFGAIRA